MITSYYDVFELISTILFFIYPDRIVILFLREKKETKFYIYNMNIYFTRSM